MLKLIELLLTFAKVGLFTFGGGYGMIPLIQQEVAMKGWMDAETLYQYIGICESTPGPIAVNMATFIGSAQAGFFGSVFATLGVVLPSFVIILAIARVMQAFRENRFVAAALSGIRPVVAGMIAATGVCIALKCAVVNFSELHDMSADVRQILIAAIVGALVYVWCKVLKRKFSPILLIATSAVLGAIVYAF